MVASTPSNNALSEHLRHYMPFECWVDLPHSNGDYSVSYSIANWDLKDRIVFTIQTPRNEHLHYYLLLQQTNFAAFDKSSKEKQRRLVATRGNPVYL